MRWFLPALLISVLIVSGACIGGGGEEDEGVTKYVCPNEMVVTDPKYCPRIEKRCEETIIYRYVCPDGSTVNESAGCPKQEPIVKLRYVCPDTSVVDDPRYCGRNSSNSTTTTSTTTTVTVTEREVEVTEIDLIEDWVRIKNRGDESEVMDGWTLEDEQGHVYEFPSDFTLDPGSSVRVYTKKGNDTDSKLYWGRKSSVWNNDGDTATLRDENEEIMDKLSVVPITTSTSTTSTLGATSSTTTSTSTTTSSTTTSTSTTSTTSTTTSTSTTSTTLVPTGAIMINEIMYDPVYEEPDNEWIELYTSEGSFSLIDWSVRDMAGNSYTFSANISSYLVLSCKKIAFEEKYPEVDDTIVINLDCGGSGWLNNGGDSISLIDSSGSIIDFIIYDYRVGGRNNNKTLIRTGSFSLNESQSDGGTPGSVNS